MLPPAAPVARFLSVAVAAALALLLIGLTDDPALQAIVPAFVVVMYLQAAPLLWSRSPDLFSPLVLHGLLGLLALVTTLASFWAAGGVELSLIPRGDSDLMVELSLQVLLLLGVALVFQYAGYYSGLGTRFRRSFPAVHGAVWSSRRLLIVSIVCLAIFTICFAVFQMRVGTGLFDLAALKAGKAVWRDDPTLSWMLRGVQLGFLPLLFYVTAAVSRLRGRQVALALLGLLLVGALVTRLGQRGMALFAILNCLIVYHYCKRRIPVGLFLAGWFAALVVNNVLGELRREGAEAAEESSFASEAESPIAAMARHEEDRQRFAALAVVLNSYPERYDYLLGQSWAAMVVLPVPRWLWPEKGEHFIWRDTSIIWNIAGAPIPLPLQGVLFANFSWIGVALGMFLWGIFQRALYEWLRAHAPDRSVVLLYAMMLVYFGPTLLQMSATLQFVLPIYATLIFISVRAGSRNARASPVGLPGLEQGVGKA